MAGGKKAPTKKVETAVVAVASAGSNNPSGYKKLGRKTLYTEELAQTICDRIANGETLLDICEEENMPGRTTVLDWLNLYDNFRAAYAIARENQGHHTTDRMSQIERGVLDGTIDPQAARVVLWSSQWRAARSNPKSYSERVINEHSGPNGAAIQMQTTVLDAGSMTPEEREVLRSLLQAAKARKEG